jgi:hypothetical protein
LDVVLVRLVHEDGHHVVVLRQFIAPDKLISNRDRGNLIIAVGDVDLRPEVVGVVRERVG